MAKGLVKDYSKSAWLADIRAILNCNADSSTALYNLLKNLSCHYVLEQYMKDKDKKEFIVNVAPYGMAKLEVLEDDVVIKEFSVYPDYKRTLLNTLATKESNLFRQEYDAVLRSLVRKLEAFSERSC